MGVFRQSPPEDSCASADCNCEVSRRSAARDDMLFAMSPPDRGNKEERAVILLRWATAERLDRRYEINRAKEGKKILAAEDKPAWSF